MFYSWTIPMATDNSGARPNVTVFPVVSPPLLLGIEEKTITYTAIDPEGNVANCSFTIKVEGNL